MISVRKTDPFTSREAAASDRSKVRNLVLKVLREHPDGMTDEELHAECIKINPSLSESSPRKRRGELVRDGLAEKVPDVTRKSDHGKNMLVWRAKTVKLRIVK